MAILNFPSDPEINDQYTGDNGTTYIYDGVKWVGHAAGGAAGTNSLQNGSFTVQVDVDGNLVLPVGSVIKDAAGDAIGANLGNLTVTDSTITSSDAYVNVFGGDLNATFAGVTVNNNYAEFFAENDQEGDTQGWAWIRTEAIDHTNPSAFIDIQPSDTGVSKRWTFDKTGKITLPAGGDILDSNGTSVLGGGTTLDQSIWVQTFNTATPNTDVPHMAPSVEYDSLGNIVALFNHYDPTDDTTYTSVGKYSTDGTRIWTVRLGAGYNADGWGLAIASNDTIYVAGKTGGGIAPYDISTLTKLSGTDGSIVWSKTYDFGIASTSTVVDVASDGNPVVVGYTKDANNNTDYITTTKINATTGAVIWSRKLDGQTDEDAYGMAVGPAGEIVVIGYMDQLGLGSTDAVATVVTVPSSNPNWVTKYGGGQGEEFGLTTNTGVTLDIIVTDGVPVITIRSDAVGGRTVGDTIATLMGSAFGGTDGIDDMVINVATVATAAGDQDDRMVVVKYNSSGSIQWQKAVQFDAGYNCVGADADIDSNGNIYVTGSYQIDLNPGQMSAMSIVKFDGSGVKQWSRRVIGDCETFATSIVVGPDDKLYLSGVTENAAQNDYSWVVAKYAFDGTVEWQRLIDNTTTWTFGGGQFFGAGGGSNIAVKQDYVALSGSFGDPGVQPHAVVLQIAATGDSFSVGNWDFTTANFSGLLNGTASDITVIDAQLTDSNNASSIAVTTSSPDFDSSDFLLATLYRANVDNNELVNGNYSFRLESDGSITLPTKTVVDGTSWNNQITQPTLSLGSNTGDVTITDTASDVDHRGNRNILIQGERGFYANGQSGAGGKGTSINIIGGLGGESSEPNNGGEGGTINIRGGTGQHGGPGGGWVNIYGGDAAEWNDAAGSPSGGRVYIKGGNAYALPTGKGFGGDVFLQAGQGENGDGPVRVETYNREKGQWNGWTFSPEGSLQLPQGYSLSRAQSVWINAGSAPTVAYTSIDPYVGSIKATIKVYVRQADDINGDHDEDTQVCEMLIATKQRYIDNGGTWIKTAVGSVYGVTHTSAAPLATFTVNFVQGYVAGPGIPPKDVVQILAEPTAAVTGTNMWVMVAATEMTND